MPENNQILSVEGQLIGMPTAGPESFSQQQLDYLKRALGVDETVLYNNTSGTPTQITSDTNITLSESVFNFEKVRIIYILSFGSGTNQNQIVDGLVTQGATFQVGVSPTYGDSGGNMCLDRNCFTFLPTAETTCTVKSGGNRLNITSSGSFSTTANRGITLLKIIGIHRIAGGN